MNVPNTKFSRKTMKHLNHNASTLTNHIPIKFTVDTHHVEKLNVKYLIKYNLLSLEITS